MDGILTAQEIGSRLKSYQGWKLGEDGQLHCLKIFGNFSQMLLFVNAVGYLAESADHHPDLYLHSYKKLMISLMSHDKGGITEKDFDLVDRIEKLPGV